jgi:hypothetical protein
MDCKNMKILLVLTTCCTTMPSEVNKSTFHRENIRKLIDNSMKDIQIHEILLLLQATHCNLWAPEVNTTTFYQENNRKCLRYITNGLQKT